MVSVYIGGKKLSLTEAENLFEGNLFGDVFFADESGRLLGRFVPLREPLPKEPIVPWDPSITEADLERIKAEPGYTFEEVKTMLGWK